VPASFRIDKSVASNKPWSDVDKSRIWQLLKQGLEEGAEGVTAAIREVYAVVKAEINKDLTQADCWGPHHEVKEDGTVVLNRNGLVAAAVALADARAEPNLTPQQKHQAARHLLIGNPTQLSGEFYNAFRSPLYHKIHISAFDSPNLKVGKIVRPYLVTPEWVEEKRLKWGEDNPLWYSRVLGEFPEQGDDTLIPLAWIEAAQQRWQTIPPGEPMELGVDVARYGTDTTVIILRQGSRAEVIAQLRGQDTMEVTGAVINALRETEAKVAKVDVVGLGAGVADRLKEQRYPVQEMNAGEAAQDKERFVNKRAEWYWALRERFQVGDITIPPDDELASQLASLKYKFDSRGRVQIESKEEMRKRGLSSPDKADALMLAFAPSVKRFDTELVSILRGAKIYG